MSSIDKRELREAAEKATPGPWEYYPGNTSIEYNVDSMVEDQGSIVYVDSGDFTQKQTDLNGAFIAAANPATVLALLDERERNLQYIKRRDQENENIALTVGRLRVELEAAKKRIAELEAEPVSQTYKLNELSGNSPVTPDGWISCSERMPEYGQHVIILCDGAFVLYAQYRDGEFFDVVRNGEEFFETQSRNVTDWMPLPEPPQEVK